jgi:AAA ATPase domain
MSERVSSPSFVGRAEELGLLAAALERAGAGAPGIVLIAGEAGVGKTRLVDEFAAQAAAEGTLVLAGGCIELGEGALPYAPIVEALRSLVRGLDLAVLRSLAGPAHGLLAGLLPELGDGQAEAVPGGSQARLFEVLLGLLGRLGEQAPVVLVVEDLHWADRSTRDLLAFLVRNLHAERVLLVATYRSDELHRRHPMRPFLAELARGGRVQRVDLAPFGREELAALLAGITGVPPTAATVDDILARTEGNAFFAEELVAAAAERAGSALPPGLRDVLLIRFEALSEPAQVALRVPDAPERAGLDHLSLLELAAEAASLAGDHHRSVAMIRAAVARTPTPPRPRHPCQAPSSASPRASGRCWRWSPRGGPTGRSPRSCSSAARPPACTSPTSWRSSPSATGSRPPRPPSASASFREPVMYRSTAPQAGRLGGLDGGVAPCAVPGAVCTVAGGRLATVVRACLRLSHLYRPDAALARTAGT